MKNCKHSHCSLINALGVLVYVSLVAILMFYGQALFGKMAGFFGVMAFLLLFVISASVVGALVLGKPVMLYLDNKKEEAVKLLIHTIGWLVIFMIVVFVVVAFV